jgi:hypothetical protein
MLDTFLSALVFGKI